ncbi:hypothetical protein PSHT_00552 [Puccinia striiformis]|uniref:Uncharacterized protein n=3 Tax=Puccinia striiformis TaxID=27350 RepID=A0A0L0VSX9_9BASI|nr:hypothetical protein PSTG_04296 [Puccinia striiformis f. sp. tritici PST-78]POW06395.1 hypothetical protein PSTT_09006 [Puccinia striiformis]POW23127.1 hypothetical protein PSHT_00552 [Puccinia striiformis]
MDQRIDDQIGPQREEQTKVYKTWSGFPTVGPELLQGRGCNGAEVKEEHRSVESTAESKDALTDDKWIPTSEITTSQRENFQKVLLRLSSRAEIPDVSGALSGRSGPNHNLRRVFSVVASPTEAISTRKK